VAEETLFGFFTRDFVRVQAAVAEVQRGEFSHGAVTSPETMRRHGPELRFDPRGLFSQEIFADGKWGHVDVVGVVHPIFSRDGASERDFLTRIPVPPPAARPLLRDVAPTMVDPALGPVNLAWVALVDQARRERRLVELEAPPEVLEEAALATQRALREVFLASLPPPRLVPPLASSPERLDEDDVVALAYVRSDLLVVARKSGVYVTNDEGAVIRTAPPAGCKLVGIRDDRIAVFQGFLPCLHPSLLMEDDVACWGGFVHDDASGTSHTAPHVGEISALDCDSGAYLVDVPPGLPLPLESDQPEDLFFVTDAGERRRLHVGSDRPRVLAMTRDLRFAWVGEVGATTQVIDVATGITHVHPAAPEIDEDECGDVGAVAFRDRRWHFLWHGGWYADHTGAHPFRVAPSARAAAFDPSGARLAVICEDEIVIADVERREVVRRFALPGPQ